MRPLVSVIVPVYKVEKYLRRCLNSLCRQSLKDIEVLLIDDASQDYCGVICEEYAAKDTRFKVFHHTVNKGLSEARNTGIHNASGVYLMFVDSDDWVHEDFCKIAYECAACKKADLVMFCWQRIMESKYCRKIQININSGYKTQLEAMDLLHNVIGEAAWNKLYRKELFYDISFPPSYLYEDVGTTYKLVWRASRIFFINKILYYNNYRVGSITTMKTEKSLHDNAVMFMQQYHDLKAWGYPDDKLDIFSKKHALEYCIKKKRTASDLHYIFCVHVLLNNKCISSRYFTYKQKFLILLFKYCRPLFELICVLYDKKVC